MIHCPGKCALHHVHVMYYIEPRCHVPVSGRGMQRFLQFRLGCHSLPVAAGRLAGAAHVDRAHRVCLACNSGAVGDEMHLVFCVCCPCFFTVSVCEPVHR